LSTTFFHGAITGNYHKTILVILLTSQLWT